MNGQLPFMTRLWNRHCVDFSLPWRSEYGTHAFDYGSAAYNQHRAKQIADERYDAHNDAEDATRRVKSRAQQLEWGMAAVLGGLGGSGPHGSKQKSFGSARYGINPTVSPPRAGGSAEPLAAKTSISDLLW